MSTIEDIQKEIVEEFEGFGDWMEKYNYIIELGHQSVLSHLLLAL